MPTDPILGHHADLATVTIGRLREAWPWLADLVEPGRRRHRQPSLSPGARAQLDRLVLAERAERAQLARAGLRPTPPTATPVNVAAVDAQITIQGIVEDCAWRIASSLRLRRGMSYFQTGRTGDERVQAALDYLAVMLRHVDDLGAVTDAAVRLDAADRLARNVAGVTGDRRHLDSACPACGRRSLYAEIGSPKYTEWAILCLRDDCRCRGFDCACRRPGRTPLVRHVWPEREWEALAVRLNAQEAA